jgi:urease accessory protein
LSYRQIARVLGNLATYPVGARTVERVAIPSDALARRVLRLASAVGDLGVRLDDDARVRAGDVLYADENRVIAVDVLPEPVLIVRPGS